MTRQWLSMVLISATLVGCEIKKRDAGPASDTTSDNGSSRTSKPSSPEVVALRDEVLAKVTIWRRHDYVPADWSIVDPAIVSALVMVGTDPRHRADLIDFAANSVYQKLTADPAGVALLEKALTARYNHPAITRDGDLVRIDLGVVAGTPIKTRHGVEVISELAEQGGYGLLAPEVIRNLEAGMAAQPDAKAYQVEVDVPGREQNDGFTYVYDVAEDRIRVYQNDKTDYYYVTQPLGGDLATVTTLSRGKLEQRPFDRPPIRSTR